MSFTIPIILVLVAIVWFVAAGTGRTKGTGLTKHGIIGGVLALLMAAVVLGVQATKTTISAQIVIPLLIATIFEFGLTIAAVSRLLHDRVSQNGFLVGVLIIIGMNLVGVVLMFQPVTPKIFNLGFDFVLIALLAFNVWSHVTPRARRELAGSHEE